MEAPSGVNAAKTYLLNPHAREALVSAKRAIKKELEDPVDFETVVNPNFQIECGHILSFQSLNLIKAKFLKLICPLCKGEESKHFHDTELLSIVLPVLECIKQAIKKMADPKSSIDLTPLLEFHKAHHEEDYILECGHHVSANVIRTTQKVEDVKVKVLNVKCPQCPKGKPKTPYLHRPLRAIAACISKFIELNNNKIEHIKQVIEDNCENPQDYAKAVEYASALSPDESMQLHTILLKALQTHLSKRKMKVEVLIKILKILPAGNLIAFLIDNVFEDLRTTWFSGTKAMKAEQAFFKVFDDSVKEQENLKRYEVLFYSCWFRRAKSCELACLNDENFERLVKFRSTLQTRLKENPKAAADLDWSWALALVTDRSKAMPLFRDPFSLGLEFIISEIKPRPISSDTRDLVEITAKCIIYSLHQPLSLPALDRVMEVYPGVLPNLVQILSQHTAECQRDQNSCFEYFQFWIDRIRQNQFLQLEGLSPSILAFIFNQIAAHEIESVYLNFLPYVNAILHIIDTYTPEDQTLKLQFFEGCYRILSKMIDTTPYVDTVDVLYENIKNPSMEVEFHRCVIISRTSHQYYYEETWAHLLTMINRGIPDNLRKPFNAFLKKQLEDNIRIDIQQFMTIFRYLCAQNEIEMCMRCFRNIVRYVMEPEPEDYARMYAALEEMLTSLLEKRSATISSYNDDYVSFVASSLENLYLFLFMDKQVPSKNFQDKIFDLIEYKELKLSSPQIDQRAQLMTDWIKKLLVFQNEKFYELAKSYFERSLKSNIFAAASISCKELLMFIKESGLSLRSKSTRPSA